jgi:glycosyltransferase involved in cell wall biosynthesis
LNNSRWKKRVAAWLFKDEQLRRATCFRALCAAEADAIRAYGLKQRIEVVPNGVGLPEKLTTEDTESTEGKRRLLFLGRIHPKKGLVGALRAWADIQNPKSKIHNSKRWQFVIAGWDQGGHEGELKKLCTDLGLRIAECREAEDLKLNSYKLKTHPSLVHGAALVTSLYQRYLPLIRYRQGDVLGSPSVLSHGHVARFERLQGRVNDMVVLEDGTTIHSLAVAHCIRVEGAVLNMQMVLEDAGPRILLVTRDGLDEESVARIRHRLGQISEVLANVPIQIVQDLITTRAGKRRWIVDTRSNKH